MYSPSTPNCKDCRPASAVRFTYGLPHMHKGRVFASLGKAVPVFELAPVVGILCLPGKQGPQFLYILISLRLALPVALSMHIWAGKPAFERSPHFFCRGRENTVYGA